MTTGYYVPSILMAGDIQEENSALRRENARLNEVLKQIQSAPAPWATILHVDSGKVTILKDHGTIDVLRPSFPVSPGMRVRVHHQSMAILNIIENPWCSGNISSVVRVVDDQHCEIQLGQGTILAMHGQVPPKAGDRVILDPTNSIVIRNLGPAVLASGPGLDTGVSWDDIGGCVEAKRDLIEAIESPHLDKDLHSRYGQKRPRGVLLCGPPGVGKTMLGKAAATALARIHGQESTASGFRYVKGPELLNKFVGESEANIRRLFSEARAHEKKHGYPAIVFLDEADALLSRRGASRFDGMERTIVPMFLAEMDGLEDSGAFVMIATNRPDMIDPAIVRDGRLDTKILVSRPSREDARDILRKHFAGRPLADTETLLSSFAVDQLFHERHALYMIRTKSGRDHRFTMGHVVSGAMCAGLVQKATILAMRREKETSSEGGIEARDLLEAADRLCTEQRMLDHTTDLAEFTQAVGSDLRDIEKVKG